MIHTRGLARTFRAQRDTVTAVAGIDLDVEPGELVAFLGPNGAGKSTTLRMLTTLLRPTSGTATVAGHDVVADPVEVRKRIGYIGQGNGAGHAHKVRDELVNQGRFYGLAGRAAREQADRLLTDFNLSELAGRTAATLSGGQRRRLDIAMGMVHRPGLLFLDEPSTGLDPQNRANLADQVRRLRDEHGMTVFLTTHYLDEADQLAERVLIIDAGSVIAEGPPGRLKADLAGDRVTVGCASDTAAKEAAAVAGRIDTARDVGVDGTTVRFIVSGGEGVLPEYLGQLDRAGVPARTARVDVPTLDDVFLALTGRSLRDADK